MTVTLTVLGGEELEAKAGDLIREAARLQRRVATAADRAVSKTLLPALVEAAPAYVPNRYAALLGASLRVKTQVRLSGPAAGVQAQVSAPTGGPKGRDITAIERGRLKHPLWGNKSHWYTDKIRRGFAAETLRKTKPLIVKELDSELARIRKDLEH